LISKLSQAFPAGISKFFTIGAYIGIAGSFIGMFAIWLILAAVMHALSSLFGGNGSFKRTFEITGYGYLPSFLGSIITVPLSSYYLMQAKIPQIDVSNFNPEVMKSIMNICSKECKRADNRKSIYNCIDSHCFVCIVSDLSFYQTSIIYLFYFFIHISMKDKSIVHFQLLTKII
ncbi:MAG TPA: YIP1 family protein, partial [Archaeoglobaceae archaeon]|nr:YIP1 family protein [Archaeoglobaceae archaeon]